MADEFPVAVFVLVKFGRNYPWLDDLLQKIQSSVLIAELSQDHVGIAATVQLVVENIAELPENGVVLVEWQV